jgi:hypothetical protein
MVMISGNCIRTGNKLSDAVGRSDDIEKEKKCIFNQNQK